MQPAIFRPFSTLGTVEKWTVDALDATRSLGSLAQHTHPLWRDHCGVASRSRRSSAKRQAALFADDHRRCLWGCASSWCQVQFSILLLRDFTSGKPVYLLIFLLIFEWSLNKNRSLFCMHMFLKHSFVLKPLSLTIETSSLSSFNRLAHFNQRRLIICNCFQIK